jgi:hypothetical protein
LQLPTEVLFEILCYVPNQLIVGQTCRKFFDISCELKTYALKLKTDELSENIFNVLMNSNKKIHKLMLTTTDYRNSRIDSNIEKISKVIEHFASDVQELYLRDIVMTMEVFSLFNLMPNIQKLTLYFVHFEDLLVPEDFSLNMFKLKELEIDGNISSKIGFKVLDRLPDNVLHKITLDSLSQFKNGKFFENQQNIKEIVADDDNYELLNFRRYKLLSIVFPYFHQSLEEIVNGQDELTLFSSGVIGGDGIPADDLRLICQELISLQELSIYLSRSIPISCFQEFSKLKKLKKASLMFCNCIDINEKLSLIQVESLQELYFYFEMPLLEATLIQLSLNCRRLRTLRLTTNDSLNLINKILLHFPQLEILSFFEVSSRRRRAKNLPIDKFVFTFNSQHLNLKHLHIGNYTSSQNCHEMLPVLVNCCKSLEEFSTEMKLDLETLQEILQTRPNLKSICFTTNSENNLKLIAIIKNFGKNLENLHFYGKDVTTMDKMIEEFKDQFSFFNNAYKTVWILKKKESVKKCCFLA